MNASSLNSSPVTRRNFTKNLAGMAAVAAVLVPPSGMSQPINDSAKLLRTFSPLAFGAKGDGLAKDTAAIQKTIDACADAGGGVVALDAGHIFLCGSLTLRPHVQLYLSPGSMLRTSPDRADFHATGALLFAKDISDVRVSGTGIIDGNFSVFFPAKGPDGYSVPQPFLGPYDPLASTPERNPADGRPRMILLVNCRRIKLEDFTIQNSPTWTIHPIGCEDVSISRISILNDLEVPNCDGIDIDHCRNVRVDSCNIKAGDDCLILKASRNFGEYGPCEAITITNCTLESSSAAIKVEPEGPYPVHAVVISNCTILRSNRGISILNRDGSDVEDLVFSSLIINTKMRSGMWWGSGEPIAVSSLPREGGGNAGRVRNITFSNIICRGESGLFFYGSSGAPLTGISLHNVDVSIEKTTEFPGGFYDMRPGSSFGPTGLNRRKTAGVFATQVDGLGLDSVNIRWSGRKTAAYGAALELHNCTSTSLSQCHGAAADDSPATIFDQVTFAKALTQ